MVDMESHYQPPSPLEDSVLGSPLCGEDEFMGEMGELQDISQSMNSTAARCFDGPEYQSSSNGSEGSTVLGEVSSSLNQNDLIILIIHFIYIALFNVLQDALNGLFII